MNDDFYNFILRKDPEEEEEDFKNDFFDAIINYGCNIEEEFVGINNFPKEEKKMKDTFLKVHDILNIFLENLIKNFSLKKKKINIIPNLIGLN